MRLVRKSTSEAVSLEDGFLWSDEFEWKPLEQKLERAIDGTLLLPRLGDADYAQARHHHADERKAGDGFLLAQQYRAGSKSEHRYRRAQHACNA